MSRRLFSFRNIRVIIDMNASSGRDVKIVFMMAFVRGVRCVRDVRDVNCIGHSFFLNLFIGIKMVIIIIIVMNIER